MKRIITHTNPDLDAVTSVWLIKKFLPGWEEARVEFVISTESADEKNPRADTHPDVLWVDVGRGRLDHHQLSEMTCAAELTLDFIKRERKKQPMSPAEEKALKSLIAVVREVDTARDLVWPEVKKDRYSFYLHLLIDSLRGLAASDEEVLSYGLKSLEAVLLNIRSRHQAQKELKEGKEFQTPWGRALALSTGNKQVLWVGEVMGYALIVNKEPESGSVRIYARWDNEVDLTKAYRRFQELDPQSDWFLHGSKKMLLNQASVNPKMKPTKLSLAQIIKELSP